MANPARKHAVSAAPSACVLRRHLSSESARVPVRHVTLPFATTAFAHARPNETVAMFLRRNGWATRNGRAWTFPLPTVCVVNGRPVRQCRWKRLRIRVGDAVEFWSRPWGKSGGTGKKILGIVALVALAAFAPWAGGALAGAIGFGTATFWSGAILMGGSLLISALTQPKPAANTSPETTDQVESLYSVSAAGNQARLFQPLPVQYGRMWSQPDYVTPAWSEYEGNDEYLNVLLSLSEGKMSHETLYLDDTILWTAADGVASGFSGVAIEFYPPETPVTLFPTNVVPVAEVSGQELSTTPVGGFATNGAGTITNALAVDLTFPGGCFKVNQESNNLESSSVTVVVETRPIDGAGAPTGGWSATASKTYTFATRNPIRQTIKFAVSPGRYEARVSRTTAAPSDTTEQNGLVWAGLRAFIEGPSSYPTSTCAIRIKANAQLTSASARRFGYVGTRILPVWNTATETWVEQPTRNPFWAEYDAATNATYGVKRPPSKVDFQTLYDEAVAADARGDTFDYRFTAATVAPDALDTILRPARARHRWSGDVLTFVRDQWSSVPRMLLTDREIVRGSFNVEYALNPDDAADAVVLEYVDEGTWKGAEVQYPPNTLEFTAQNPSRIRVPGIVKRANAYKEAGFYYLQSQYRRINVGLDTEHDGRMLGYGSRVRVQTSIPESWGSTGAVVARTGNTLTVSPTPTWATGAHYIAIRTKTGKQFGPVLCTQGAGADKIVLNSTDLAAVETSQGMTLANALARADGADDPSFDFGPGSNRARDCIVMTGRPSRNRVTLGLVVDNTAVHDTDLGDTPVLPTLPALRNPTAPIVAGLVATWGNVVAEPRIEVSWWPAAGAQYYVAHVSYDDGESWSPIVYEGSEPRFSAIVDRAALRVRVQGVGTRQGAFSFFDLPAPTIEVAAGAVSLQSLIEGLRQQVTGVIDGIDERISDVEQRIAAIASNASARNWLEFKDVRTQLQARSANALAQISELRQVAVDTEAAFAQYKIVVDAKFEDVESAVDIQASAIATLNGYASSQYGVTLTAQGYATGFSLVNGGSGYSSFTVVGDVFKVAFPGISGGAPVTVFTIGSVNGAAKITFRGDMYADGSITAGKLSVATLSAISANIGDVTAGVLRSNNNLLRLDLTAQQFLVFDS